MKESESIQEYHNRVIVLLNQMRINGENTKDRRVVEMILRSLTIKLEYMIDPMFLLPKVLTHDRSVHEKNLG